MWLEITEKDNDNEILKKTTYVIWQNFLEVIVDFKKIINRTVLN
jgi:hypothetical protein